MYKKILLVLISIVFLAACGGGKKPNTDDPNNISDGTPVVIDPGILDGIVQSFSSPIEMAALVQEVGVPFSLGYLCPTDNIDNYNTDFKKAFGLGLLSSDLGYLNIYEKTSAIVNYITVIKRLADDIKVGQFFDFPTLKRLATNNEHLDSLMYLSVHSFNEMDNYLREHNKSDLSTLIVSGVWLEGLYLATQVVKQKGNERIEERIGEQKTILNDLIVVMGHYKNNKNFENLISDFEKIKKSFDGVEISYQFGEPTRKTVGDRVVVEENSVSTVKISKEQLKVIIKATEEVRNKLISK